MPCFDPSQTSPAKCLTYLTSAHLFVGSHFADSLVLQILPSPIPFAGSYLAPPSSAFANLAPVLDFCVSARGEGGVVTCSGGNGAGSLRVVRDGAGWEEELRVEGVDAVDRVWSVPSPLRCVLRLALLPVPRLALTCTPALA